MKNKLFLSLLATGLSALTAWAIPLNITAGALGYATNSQYDSVPTNLATPGNGSNVSNDVYFLQEQINLWTGNPALQSVYSGGPVGAIAANVEGLSGSIYNTLPGLQYVVLHWGGAGGGSYQAYYLGGLGGTVYAPSGAGGLSSARYVPDGGSSVMLLGAALSVIAVARRKFGV